MIRHIRHITTILLLCVAASSSAQSIRVECFSGYLTGDSCDVCSPTVETRSFTGLLVWKDSVIIKHIDCPYVVRQFDSVLTFKELLPNPDQILIHLAATGFDSLSQFRDSTLCKCGGYVEESGWFINDSMQLERIIGDTVTFAGAGTVTVEYDSVTNVLLITGAGSEGGVTQMLSATGAGPLSYDI
jgi:hypothetical protein